MDFFDVVQQRCSIRQYQPRAIPLGDLEKIIDAARLAPTARGVEPWEFIVITRPEGLNQVGQATDTGRFIAQSAACIAVVCQETKYYLEDGCAATENILLAARALGIGSCWVAGDKKPYTTNILQQLHVPAGYKLVSLVALGYPSGKFSVKTKRPLKSVWHAEKF